MKRKNFFALCLLICVLDACKDRYTPDINYPETGYLVVEGFINSGQGATTIRISRTAKLSDISSKFEVGAVVTVEGSDNSRYLLSAQPSGLYVNNQLTLDRTKKYRLHIRTSNAREYFSDYASPIATPPIDSINYTLEDPGLVMHINTHDPQNKTKYYTWNYEETWEINAAYYPTLKYVKSATGQVTGVAPIFPNGNPDTTKFRCWQFENSSTILTGSSIKLTEDRINLPLYSVKYGSEKMSVLYSVIVYQRGVSEQGFDFLQRMKKNTQQVGSIFDAQPSELNSNVHSTTNPTEPVIGFVDVADAQQKRIFIDARINRVWPFSLNCEEKLVALKPDSLNTYSYLNAVEFRPDGNDTALFAVSPRCADCTVSGVNRKPTFWPR